MPATAIYGSLTPTAVTAQSGLAGGGVAPTGGLSLAFTPTAGGSYGAPSCSGSQQSDHVHGDVYADGDGRDGHLHHVGDLCGRQQLQGGEQRANEQLQHWRDGTTVVVTSVNPATEIYGSLTPTTVMATLAWTGGGTAPTGGLDFGTNAPRTRAASAGQLRGAELQRHQQSDHLHGDVYADGHRRGGHVHHVGDVMPATATTAGRAARRPTTSPSPTDGVTVNVTSVSPATEIYGSLTATLVTAQLSLDGRRDGADGRAALRDECAAHSGRLWGAELQRAAAVRSHARRRLRRRLRTWWARTPCRRPSMATTTTAAR